MGIYLPDKNDFSWFEATGPRNVEKVFSEYVVKFHSSSIQELSCRDDVSVLESFTTETGAVAFETNPKIWITNSPFLQKLDAQMYDRLIDFVLNERGMFPKVWRLEAQKNYWNSTYNGGLPIVRKRDPVHEGTFMLHDIWHFVFVDSIITGEESESDVMAYVANRLMSEAFTLILTDMIAIDHSNIEKDGYDVGKRRIYPVFKSSQLDSQDLESVRKFLYANSVFALFGDTSEYEKFGIDSRALADFNARYSVFFSVDLQWNVQNAHNQIERFGVHENLTHFIKELPPEIQNQSSASLYQRIKQENGALSFDRLFNIFWDQFLEVIRYDKPFNHFEYARRGVQKYISGQIYAAFLYNSICESHTLIKQYRIAIEKLRSTEKLEDVLLVYKNFRVVFERYISCLEKKEIILPDEKQIYTLHMPHFPPIYLGYDNPPNSYESLSGVSERIFRGKLVKGTHSKTENDIEPAMKDLFNTITKSK